jgi:formate dehydrogenase iron-sulfur subunit
VENGMLPACVKACPTGAMNFGEREDMLKLADARLKEVKADYPQAGLVDKDFVKVIYLSRFEPKLYYEYMYAENRPRNLMNRQQMLARMFRPFKEVIDSA